jgi:hypothetical protein
VVDSEGQRLLLALDKSLGEIASAVRCNRTSVLDWRNGNKTPVPEMRARLFTAYAIPTAAWDRVPTTPEPERSSLPPADGATPTTLETCVARLAQLSKQLGHKGLRPADAARFMTIENRYLALRNQLQKEAELLEDRIVREHPRWQALRGALLKALAPHPAAAKAVIDVLTAQEM